MIFGFLLTIAFDPYIWTGATQPRWALLAVSLPILISVSSPNHFTVFHLTGLLFLTWATITLAWTANLWDGLGEFAQMCLIALAIVYGSRQTSLSNIFKGMALGITISSLILLIPILRFNSIVLVYPHGLFGNRNMMSEVAALTALGLIAYKQWFYLPGILPAIFYYKPEVTGGGLTRSALLALSVGVVAFIWQRSRLIAVSIMALATVGMVFLLIDPSRLSSLSERITVWQAVWHGSNWLGHGLGSLYTLAPYLSAAWDTTLQRIDHAHNEAIEIYFELGCIGIGLYAGIIAGALCLSDRQTMPVLLGFLVISTVAFPWHIPANAFVGAIVIGHAVRSGLPVRDHYHAWRTRLRAWHKFKNKPSGPDTLSSAGGYLKPI